MNELTNNLLNRHISKESDFGVKKDGAPPQIVVHRAVFAFYINIDGTLKTKLCSLSACVIHTKVSVEVRKLISIPRNH